MKKIQTLILITFSLISVNAQDIPKPENLDSQELNVQSEISKAILVYSQAEPILKEHKGAYASAGDGLIPYSKADFKGFINDSVKKIILEVSFNRPGFIGYAIFLDAKVKDGRGAYCLGIGKVAGSLSPHVFKLFGPHAYYSLDSLLAIRGDEVKWDRKDKKIKHKENYRKVHDSYYTFIINTGARAQPFVTESQEYISNKNSEQSKVELLFDVERDEFTHMTLNGYGFDFSNNPFDKVLFKVPFKKNYNSRHKKITLIY